MKKVVLAIQTPRAGELHYLWITPFVNGETISDNKLGKLLSKLRSQLPKDVNTDASSSLDSPQLSEALSSGVLHNSYYNDDSSDNEDYDSPSVFPVGQLQENDSAEDALPDAVNSDVKDKRVEGVVVKDGMLFSKQVIQTSSGRPGNEELFLYAFGFDGSVPEDKCKECYEKLDVFFNDKLEDIIKTIDWKKAARDTSVHSSADLKNLDGGLTSPLAAFDSLYSELADLLDPYIKPEPEPIKNEPEAPDKSKSDSSGVQTGSPQPKKTSFGQYVLGLCVIIALLIPIVKMAQAGTFGDNIKQHAEDVVKFFEKIFNQQQTLPMSDEDYKNWIQLFDFPNDVKQENREELVKKAVEQTYRYYWGKNPRDKECLLDGKFANDILKMLNEGNLMVLSDKELDNSDFQCFRNVNSVEFRKLVVAFPAAVDSLKRILKTYSTDDLEDEPKMIIDNCNAYLMKKAVLDEKYTNPQNCNFNSKFFYEFDLQIKQLFDDLMNEVSNPAVQDAIKYASKRKTLKSDYNNWQDFVDDYNKCFNNNSSN